MSACATLAGVALFACLSRDPACLPLVHRPLREWLASIVEQESGFDPLAIRDEVQGRRVRAATRAQAEAEVRARHELGHTLGLGWFQITHTANWARHWGSVDAALATWADPCANLRAGATHYAGDLHAAAARRYNSGRIDDAPPQTVAYAGRVSAGAARMQTLLAAMDEAPDAAPLPRAPLPPPALPSTLATGRSTAGAVISYGRKDN